MLVQMLELPVVLNDSVKKMRSLWERATHVQTNYSNTIMEMRISSIAGGGDELFGVRFIQLKASLVKQFYLHWGKWWCSRIFSEDLILYLIKQRVD